MPEGPRVKAMVCMLSYARVAKGRHALRVYRPLQVSASHKARDVRRCQRLSHEACGRDPWYWIRRAGFFTGNWVAGEILADGNGQAGTVRGTIRIWLGSKPHRAVIFDPRFDLVGVGTVRGRFQGVRHMTIWAAHFGHHT
ncbi:MAG: CAP domain-containing protein [Solirubrobacterales bacterium]